MKISPQQKQAGAFTSVVELTLPKDSNIYASKYELYLPDKKELQEKLREWIAEETGEES